jgi:hypothetical protein
MADLLLESKPNDTPCRTGRGTIAYMHTNRDTNKGNDTPPGGSQPPRLQPEGPLSITLLGDSIFDNAPYTAGGPAVTDHLQELLAPAGTVTLCAVDGAVTRDVLQQLSGIPADTTHLIVSSGGNDALQQIGLLSENASSVGGALERFREPLVRFERDYHTLLTGIARQGLPTWCCTIYNGMLDPPYDTVAPVAAALFNDCIYRVAGEFGVPVIELRRVCTAPEDYANPIEPSVQGGRKIARAILEAVSLEAVHE